jgi:NADP-dependent 3-hydroxy acid dehydrogenase YdfG
MDNFPLQGHTIFITGATSGFGEACARLLASKGAQIIICGRRGEKLKKLQKELGEDSTYIVELDVRHKDKLITSINNLPEKFKNITALINNAGLAIGQNPAQHSALEDWDQMVDTNIKGVLYCTHAILPLMIANNNGYIINIGSVAGTYPYPGGNVYGASKAFIRQFSFNLRSDLMGTRIRVTNLEPGIAETEFSLVRYSGNEEKAKNVYAGTKPLVAEDIAETILWCLSRPSHVNINSIEVMPLCQAFGPFYIKREEQ